MYDLIIVGGGPAGLTAGLYAVREGLRTLLLEKQFAGGQVATTNVVENYPGFPQGVGGPELCMQMEAQAVGAGLTIQYAAMREATLAGDVKRVLAGDAWLEARAVILAMGVSPRKLAVPGEDALTGRGVSFCATCDGAFYRGARVAVLGGGNTAAEEALYLANIADHVTLVHRRDKLRAEAVLAARVLNHPKITVCWNAQVEAFEGDAKLQAVVLRTQDGAAERLAVNGAFVAIGKVPETLLVRGQLACDEEGFIQAGEDTHTSLPRVYAAGDVRVKRLRQVVTAAADGAVAAAEAGRALL